jgi:hypothetical protein
MASSTLLEELQALPIGTTRTVSWDELRPYFPGLTDKQRWEAMLARLDSRNLSHEFKEADFKVRPDGTYETMVSIERRAPTG